MSNEPTLACPLCRSSRSQEFPIYYMFGEKRFQANECRDCGFVFLFPRLSSADLVALYSDEYFLFDGADCGAHSPTDYETAALRGSVKFPEILGWIRTFRPSGDVFEVGCGMGFFLDYVRRNGYRVSGIEYAALGARTCRERFGLEVDQTSFDDYVEKPQSCDVVFMGDVLEHLVHPLEMLQKALRMLRASGIVAVEVPSMFNSIVGRLAITAYRLVSTQKKMPMPPYHVNEFTPATLRKILLKAGFSKAIIIQRVKSPGSITSRGTFLEQAIKKTLQYPNYALTKSLGVLGDRLLGIGVK